MKKLLQLLVLSGKKPAFYDANFVEDAALILASTLRRDGYLEPEVTAELTLEDGRKLGFKWEEIISVPLSRSLRIRKVHFHLHKGVLYHYQALQFEGLKTITEKEARSFFVETGILLPLKHYRIYTPEKLRHGLNSLTEVLEREGYEHATAKASHLDRDEKTGSVQVRIQVEQGRKSVVRSVREEFFYGGETEPKEVRTVFPRRPYSRLWEQDFTQALKTNYYHRGYPDASVEVQRLEQAPEGALVQLDLAAKVRTGQQIKLGKVEFAGENAKCAEGGILTAH